MFGGRVDESDLAGMVAAHDRLRRHLRTLLEAGFVDDHMVRGPSLLDGWSRAHVLTHLARHADSVVRALEGAARHEIVDRYSGPPGTRDREIEVGAGRSADELVADVVDSSVALDDAIASMPAAAWAGHCRGRRGEEQVASLPTARWREVVLHHTDLDLPGFGTADWTTSFVEREARRLGRPGADRSWVADRNGRPDSDPAAWTAATLDPSWCRPFSASEVDALTNALREYQRATGGVDLTPDSALHFTTDGLGELVAELRGRLIEGDGVTALEGFPVDRFTIEELRVIWWGLSNTLGRPRPQSHRGDLIGDVRDIGTGISGRAGRG